MYVVIKKVMLKVELKMNAKGEVRSGSKVVIKSMAVLVMLPAPLPALALVLMIMLGLVLIVALIVVAAIVFIRAIGRLTDLCDGR